MHPPGPASSNISKQCLLKPFQFLDLTQEMCNDIVKDFLYQNKEFLKLYFPSTNGFILITHGLVCFQLAYFPEASPLPNKTFRIVAICNRLLAYITVVVMVCYVMLCYVMLCYVMLCYVMLCYVMLCYFSAGVS